MLLRGLGTNCFVTIPTDLNIIYRTLKRLHASDADAVTRYHAQIALEELNAVTQEFMTVHPTTHPLWNSNQEQ